MAVSDDVVFGKPTVTTAKYIVKGPSGWAEVFDRPKADKCLASFVAPAAVADLVEIFVLARETDDNKKRVVTWHTIVGFLGRTMGVPPKAVPHEAGVAMWGHYVLAQLSKGSN
jgi:hypothetical protein